MSIICLNFPKVSRCSPQFGLNTRSLLLTIIVWLTMLRTASDLTSRYLISFLRVARAICGGGDAWTVIDRDSGDLLAIGYSAATFIIVWGLPMLSVRRDLAGDKSAGLPECAVWKSGWLIWSCTLMVSSFYGWCMEVLFARFDFFFSGLKSSTCCI